MVISSTCFIHNYNHKETWRSPHGVGYQIYHFLVDKREASRVIDVRFFRGSNCHSDHYLVQIKYANGIAVRGLKGSTKQKKFSIEELKKVSTRKEYQKKISEGLDHDIQKNSVENYWKSLKELLYLFCYRILALAILFCSKINLNVISYLLKTNNKLYNEKD